MWRTATLAAILACALLAGCDGGTFDPGPAQGKADDTTISVGCTSQDDCQASEYCRLATGVCLASPRALGTCQPLPQSCDHAYTPACGCDGESYANACDAAAQGISIAAQGKCAP